MTGASGSNADSISSLDAGNPLHLQTNDNNSVPLINLKLTGFENYRAAYVTSVSLSNQWERCNVVVLSWLLSSISDDLYLSQMYSENAVEFDILTKLSPCTCDAKTELENNLIEGLGLEQGCFEIIGYPNGFKRNQNRKNSSNNKGYSSNNVDVHKNSSGMPFISDQIAKLMSLIGDKPGNGIHANMAGIQCSFFNVNVFFNNNFYKFFNANIKANRISYNFRWIIDSGANQHITSGTNNMPNVIDISELNIIVGHPNCTTAKIRKVGNLKLTSNIVLFDVLVIPEYCVSILSVNKLVRDSKLHVGFDEYDCIIQDLKRENILGTGSEAGGLYVFNTECKALNFKSNNSFLCFNVSKGIWHNRLGHPSDQVLSVLENRLSIGKPTHAMPCEVCHHAKQVRELFPLSEYKSDSLESLIHLDLWGPSKVTTKDGFKLPSSVLNGKSPFIKLYGREPYLSHLRSFGYDTAREQSSDDDQGSVQIGEEDFSEGNVFENNDVPTNLFNTEESNTGRVRYGLDKFVNHTWLSVENYGFIANINMSFDPKSYKETALDKNWVLAMNEEIEVLYENNSWDLVELPKNRKAIRSKCLISLAVKNGWCLFQLDVNNAFLYGNLDEDVYMLPPPGYFDKNETRFCKLKRSLYGLKQAPRQWNNRLSEALVENDFKQSGHDHSLYTKESGGSFVALLVYVDDIVLTGNDINEINKVKIFLKSKFMIKDLGELKYFLGTEPVSTPLPKNIILAHKESEDDNQHMQAPLQSHMDLGLKVLRYLKGSPGSGMNYEKSEHMSLKVYADSDWAKCPVTRRSVSGYCVFFNGCMVSWKSKKQDTLSKSSAEAKYRSMAGATCELIWVVNILKDLKVKNLLHAELFCDNSATI
ncbi:ribonuclease H-like domain-containing protein [Tanacetum coccineum]